MEDMSLTEIEAEALKLSPEEQARLLNRLAIALDCAEEPSLTNEELEKRWANFELSGNPGIEASVLREQMQNRYGRS